MVFMGVVKLNLVSFRLCYFVVSLGVVGDQVPHWLYSVLLVPGARLIVHKSRVSTEISLNLVDDVPLQPIPS